MTNNNDALTVVEMAEPDNAIATDEAVVDIPFDDDEIDNVPLILNETTEDEPFIDNQIEFEPVDHKTDDLSFMFDENEEEQVPQADFSHLPEYARPAVPAKKIDKDIAPFPSIDLLDRPNKKLNPVSEEDLQIR